MKVLLDEDVHVKLMDWLVEKGHDVLRVPSGFKNGQVIGLAKRESRVLITRDKDFANRLMYPPSACSGIVILRVHPPELGKLILALQMLLAELAADQVRGKLIIVEEEGYHLLS
ncbi:MAG: DUF5615 family PIN-like protein [Candidatus Omnitrophica bacterium]|nr:DUF5615 family PIN-like protein [Candidatus Omnitrophota bacterium]